MPKYRFDLVQGSEDWLGARLGIPTASEFSSVITPKKLALSESARPFLCKLLAEWLNGAPLDGYDAGAHGWGLRGKELEPEAVRYYEMEKSVETDAIGFVTNAEGTAGASPDRLVGEVGLYEGKAPGLVAHVGYLLDPQTLLDEYRIQHQGQLWICADREWVDMHSYHPGFPSVIVRSYRDERVQAALSTHIPAFVEIMLAARVKLTQMYGELRRERVTAQQRVEESRAAFDEFMDSKIGGVV